MSKKQLRILFSFLSLILLWELCAITLDNDIILPKPTVVIVTMIKQIGQPVFFASVTQTLLRILTGFVIAITIALVIAFLSYFYPWFADLFYPFLLLTRSIPNISYILIVLFWCSASMSVIVISLLILFPTMYATLYQGLCDVPREYRDIMKIYPGPKRYEIRHVYMPYLRSHLFAATSAGVSLALKVGIMAEILGQAKIGIGRQLNICRLNLDMAGVFAWTIWIILLLFVIDRMIYQMKKFILPA